MTGKYLGKIVKAEFGRDADYPFLIGLKVVLSVGNVGCVTANVLANIEHDNAGIETMKVVEYVNKILKDAKCYTVSELAGKPVEVTLENNTYRTFRILKECI